MLSILLVLVIDWIQTLNSAYIDLLLLRNLHDQTDHALADIQAQLTQAEGELYNYREKVRTLEAERGETGQVIAALKDNIVMLKGTLSEVNSAKDGMLVSPQEVRLCFDF